MEEIIITENLTKEYKDIIAVNSISIHVKKGEIYGFLGLNGAGKTTTIRMMLGMIKSSAGKVKILGEEVSAKNLKLWDKIGYLVEVPYSYPNLTVYENLEIVRKLRNLPSTTSVDIIIEKLHLGEYKHRLAKNLSLGNAQRLGLAKALIHEPEILILDEPTNGLDPSGIHEIRELLIDMAKNKGVTIFISSHILTEISKIANRIGIIHNGKIIQEVDNQKLNECAKKNLHVKVKENEIAQRILTDNNVVFENVNEEFILQDDVSINNPDTISKLLINSGCSLTKLVVTEEDLETYFLRTIKQ